MIKMALSCERLGCLPYSGGYYDQPYRLIRTIEMVNTWHRNFRILEEMVHGDQDKFFEWEKKNRLIYDLHLQFLEEEDG